MLRKRDFSKPIETMKTTVVLTPESSEKSSTTATSKSTSSTTMESETKDNYYYFPGCRKDANCNCEICIASFNATLDLMPLSIQRSSLTKLSASRPPPRSPISFNPSSLSTPKTSTTKSSTMSPPLSSTARMSFHQRVKKNKRELGYRFIIMRSVFCLGLVLGLEFGVSWMVFGILQPKLSVDVVRNLAEKSWVLKDLNERTVFLKNELQVLVNKEVQICSSSNSMWKINQDGLLLNSRCVLYKSMTEEVSIWGWPLQSAGLLTADFSSRSFTILSGRVTEWFNGEVSYMIRRCNSSWTQEKWSASAVQLDPKTWILEYKQSSIMENARLISAVMEFLKFRLTREVGKMKQEFWLLSAFGSQHTELTGEGFRIPT